MIDIEIIENLINEFKDKINKNNSSFTKMEIDIVQINEIENLINKYKEQEKIIELMAKDIAEHKIDEDICRQVKDPNNEDCYNTLYYDDSCSDCVIEYYEKKVKGE